MSITYDINEYYDWCRDRIKYPTKLHNAKYIKQFFSHISSIANRTDGKLLYFTKQYSKKVMSYAEGTPIFYFFKVVPDKFFIENFNQEDIYKNHYIDNNILDTLLSLKLQKYVTTVTQSFDYNNYILVLLQRHDDQLSFISDISAWAKFNKILVVFKLHPLHMSITSKQYLSNSYGNKYTMFVENICNELLISNCRAVWTWNSGAAMPAVLQLKPVCYFLKDYDHTYGPAAKFCNNIEEAAEGYAVDKERVMQYFSWYYHTFIIDVSKDCAKTKLLSRFDNYFIHNYSVEELFSDDSVVKRYI